MSEQQQQAEQEFKIERIYIQDLSFEAPSAPDIFDQQWEPEMSLDLQTNSSSRSENRHDVVLSVTVTVNNKSTNKTAFLIEVKQAGTFFIKGFSQEQEHHFLGSFCPNVLYPYAREVVSDMVSRGSFPQLLLAPVNFDALYAEHLQRQAQAAKQTEGEVSE